MKSSKIDRQFVLTLLVFTICATAHAQYTVAVGNTPGGGNTVVGNGTLPALGPGSPLSAGGFDRVTLNIGSMATTAINQDTIAFSTSNDMLVNNGTVIGAVAPFGFVNGLNAIGFSNQFSGVNLINETVVNNGSVTGGAETGSGLGGAPPSGGAGISILSFFSVPNGLLNGLSLTNNGSATGGAGPLGSGGAGISIVNQSGLASSGLIVTNAGTATGGLAGTGFFPSGGAGIVIDFKSTLDHLTFNNTGSVSGGNGGIGGTGISILSRSGMLTNLAFSSMGNVTGGSGGAGLGGAGILITSQNGNIVNLALTVGGSVMGGNSHGFNGGSGISLQTIGALNWTLVNVGSLTGGNSDIGTGGSGISIVTNIFAVLGPSNLVATNWGSITGGNAGAGGITGNGIASNAGHLTINNYGAISAGSGPNPVAINLQTSSNNTINLYGHSSVNGLISAHGNANSNFLNVNFTGMSPSAIAQLKAQLTAQGVLTGQDSTGSFTVRGVTYTWDPLVVGLNLSSYQLQGFTPNQAAIGANLDSLTYNPVPGSSLFNLFNAIDFSGNVPAALEALSPQKYQVYGDLAIANSTATVQNVDARLNNIRDGSESIDTTGVGGGTTATTTAGFSKDDGKESKEVVPPPAPEKRWGMFATGNGLFFRGNVHDVDLQEGKSNTAGTVAGVDAKIGEHVIFGALFAYDNADASLGADGSHATIESYTGGLYGSYHQDGFYLNGLAAYTRNNYSSGRNIIFPGFNSTAAGSANGNQYTANLDGGYDWHVTDRLTVGPLAGIQYVHLDINSFNESGAGAADLAVGSQSMDSLQSRVGGRINFHLLTQEYASFAADLHAAWQHEFLNDNRGIGAGFIGSGLAPFSIQTSSAPRDAAVVGLGLNFTFHDRLTLFADYELVLWRASYFEQTINGGARISF